MPKTKISEFSSTPANNTDIDSINIAEGCAPSGINDAIRELMAQLKDFQTGAVGDSFNGPVGTTTAAAGAFTTLSSTGNTTLGDASGDSVTINGTATFANANPTLSAGTANGVAYLNGSKVVTSGSALTFDGTSLGISTGTNTVAQNWQGAGTGFSLKVKSGVGSSPNSSVYRMYMDYLDGAATNGFIDFYRGGGGGDGYLAFGASGSEQMRLTSTGLGIGTSSPTNKLDILTGDNTGLSVRSTNYSGTFGPSGLGGMALTAAGAYPLFFYINGATRATLDSAGNLGLGVTPSAWDTVAYQAMQFPNGGTISGYKASAAPIFRMSSNVYYNSGDKYVITAAATQYVQNQGVHSWSIAPSGTAGNAITFTQALTLDANGFLFLGTTSTNPNAGIAFNSPSTAPNIRMSHANGTSSGTAYMEFNYDQSGCGSITQLGTSAVLYNTSSDYRLKNITGALTGYKERLMSLQPKQGTWKADGSEFRGFLAHEFAEPYSASVTGEKDAVDANNKPIMQAMQASSSEVMADLVAYIQHLEARLTAAGL